MWWVIDCACSSVSKTPTICKRTISSDIRRETYRGSRACSGIIKGKVHWRWFINNNCGCAIFVGGFISVISYRYELINKCTNCCCIKIYGSYINWRCYGLISTSIYCVNKCVWSITTRTCKCNLWLCIILTNCCASRNSCWRWKFIFLTNLVNTKFFVDVLCISKLFRA